MGCQFKCLNLWIYYKMGSKPQANFWLKWSVMPGALCILSKLLSLILADLGASILLKFYSLGFSSSGLFSFHIVRFWLLNCTLAEMLEFCTIKVTWILWCILLLNIKSLVSICMMLSSSTYSNVSPCISCYYTREHGLNLYASHIWLCWVMPYLMSELGWSSGIQCLLPIF